jgi:hypothetical protein
MPKKTLCEGSCGKGYWKKDLIFGPDPYQEDIHGDDTPVWLCDECHHISYMEI